MGYNEKKKDWGQIKCGKCPLCGQEDEDAPHVLRCKHPLMKAAREHELSKLSRIVNSSKTSEILQRWIMVMAKQWIQSFPPSIPPKNETFREIRKAINGQKKLSMRNMFRGILSVRWRKMHEVNLQKEYGENVSGQSWATKISKAFIDFSIAMWKIRCQIIHANNIGSEEDFFRKSSLEVCENLKKDPLSLSKHDKQLCKRTNEFFKRAPISTIKMWRKRIAIATKKQLEKENAIGRDIKRFTKRKQKSPCRSGETRISQCKAEPLLRSSNNDDKNNGMTKSKMTLNTKKESINSPPSALIQDKDNSEGKYKLSQNEESSTRTSKINRTT